MMKKIVLPGLLAGLAMLLVSLAMMPLSNFIFPGLAKEYLKPGLFRPWSDPIMSLYFVYPFVLGVALAWFWDKTKGSFKNTKCNRGVCFGFSYWLVASIPGMFVTYSSFPVSLAMVVTWSLSGLINALLAGLILAKMNK